MSFSTDIAALAELDRADVPELDRMIPTELPPAGTLFELADAYVRRRATNAWIAVLATSVTFFYICDYPAPASPLHDVLSLQSVFGSGWGAIMTTLAIASLAAHVARRRAERTFAATTGRVARGNTSLALVIAGVACFATYFTVMTIFAEGALFWIPTLDFSGWTLPREIARASYEYWNGVERLHDVEIAMPILVLASIAVARARSRGWIAVLVRLRWPSAAIATCAALVLWLHEHEWLWVMGRWQHPWFELTTDDKTVATIALAALTFIAVAGFALQRSSSRALAPNSGSTTSGSR
jgi:hypothetical protein